MAGSGRRRALLAAITACAALIVGLAVPILAHADNATVSGTVARTGWDSAEPGLAPAQVTASDFGQQFSVQLDGSIYAQPLVIGNTVVVTTEKAKVYGVSAGTGAILWQRSFGNPFEAATIGCGDLTPDLGSTSTPVYDPATNTVYLTTKIDDGPDLQHPHWYLQAVSATDGSEKSGFPIMLQGTADNDPSVTFTPYLSMQRAGLLLANGVVYIGFGSHCDIGNWKGWVMGVDVTGTPTIKTSWVAEGGGAAGAGIWAAGGGLMSDGTDGNGNPRIFLATGNGLSPNIGPGTSPSSFLGDSVVRLGLTSSGHLAAQDFFAPSNAPTLDQNDTDLGSGNPVALPDSFGTASHPHLLIQDGKDGRLFLLDRNSLGGRGQGANGGDATVATVGPFNGIWGHPAVYPGQGGWVYYVENGGPLRAYARSVTSGGSPALTPSGVSAGNFGYTSGSPIVTSDGTTAGSALVWVVYSDGPTGTNAQLRAYDATPTNGVLNLRWSASIGTASKFEMPASTGNRVFVGNRSGVLTAFGRPASVALTGPPVDVGQVGVGGQGSGTATLSASRPITVTGVSTTAPFSTGAISLPVTLQPGNTINVPITFAPTAPGAASSTLTLSTDLGPVTLDLHGTGTRPGLGAAPASLDFGTVATSQQKTLAVNISNTGTTGETIISSTLPTGPFSASGVPANGTVLPPQQSVAVPITYVPASASAGNTGSLSITSTHGTVTVALTGVAETGQGHLVFDPPTLNFGSVAIGTSRTLSFDVENTGNIPITVTKAKAPAGVFTSVSPLSEGISVGPDDVVHQQVTFTPTATGSATATYLVSSDDGQGAQLENLVGTGVAGTTLAAPTTAAWTRNGSATVSGADLVLTPAAADQAGSAFSNTVVPSDGLDAHLTAQIGGGTGADGLAFVLADASDPAASLGAGGGGLGYGGLANAVAVTLDTYQNGSDPSANFVGIADGTGGSNDALNYVATSNNIGPLTSGTHDVDVNVYGGHIRVTVDQDLKIDQAVRLPASVRPGFSAATGGLTDQHVVRGVAITTPSTVQAALAASPTAVTLPTAVVGGPATTSSVTFTNVGSQPVTITAATAPTAPFTATGLPPAGATIAAGATVTVALTYTPTAVPGQNTSAVALATAAGTISVPISGVTAAPPGTSLAPVTGAGWTENGSAAVSGTDVVLTPAAADLAGSAVSNSALPSAGLQSHFTAVLSPGGADGMTYTLLDATAPVTSLGGTGGALGYGGLTGAVAVTLDTYQNAGDPAANFVGIATGVGTAPDSLNYVATNATVPQLSPGTHDVRVVYSGGRLSVALDGTQVLNTPITLPAYVRPAFTAGTGGVVDQHSVRDVTITSPTPDKTPPTVAVTAPTAGQSIAKTATLTASASDNVAVAGVQFSIDGTKVGPLLTAAPYTTSIDTTTLTNGTHTVTATATDTSGNAATSAPVSVTVANSAPDTTPPSVSVTAPGAGSISGTTMVTAAASDNVGVQGVQFYLDGNALGAPVIGTPYQVPWDTASVPNGTHQLTATASDAAGNLATSTAVSVIVANAASTALGTDAMATVDGTGTQTSAAFSTATSGDLLLAFVNADGPAGPSTQRATVTGAGLTWTLVKRANLRRGTSEVWQARATGTLANVTVSSALESSAFQSLTVVALRGAAGIGASLGVSAQSGAPSASFTTKAAGSWLFAVGNDPDHATPRVVRAAQLVLHQELTTSTGWLQTAHPNLAAGVRTTIGDTSPTTDQFNLAAIEVEEAS
jgi:Bacterial lectin/Bacterial Ig domain/Abnormal spindle-like microcephaly-assoc'd, ASPM-SPD-2-Hydin